MALNGYKKPRTKRYGGLLSLKLVNMPDVRAVIFDNTTGFCEKVELVAEASFAEYEFREDSASLTEKIIDNNGVSKTAQEIAFAISCVDTTAGGALSEILSASSAGMLALATTVGGDSFIVGASPELELSKPLRFTSAAILRGERPEDDPAIKITLRCESKKPAVKYNGVSL